MKQTIQKQTPKGRKEIILDYETRTASIDGLPFRKVVRGGFEQGDKKYEGLYFTETDILPGKKIFITLPDAPQDFVALFEKPKKYNQPNIEYSGLGAGFKDDQIEKGTKQALSNLGLGNPFIPHREPNWRVAHRD